MQSCWTGRKGEALATEARNRRLDPGMTEAEAGRVAGRRTAPRRGGGLRPEGVGPAMKAAEFSMCNA